MANTELWELRHVGFYMMWFGLAALLGPISVMLDILPILGTISRVVTWGITFLIALLLTIGTIIFSRIVHNLTALIITYSIIALAIIMFFVMLKNKKQVRDVSSCCSIKRSDSK